MGQEHSHIGARELQTPQRGTLLSDGIFKRPIIVQNSEELRRLQRFLLLKKQHFTGPGFLALKHHQVEDGEWCATSRKVWVYTQFFESTLANEIRRRRIQGYRFTPDHLKAIASTLINALALYQEHGIFYSSLTPATLLFDGTSVFVMDPVIFDLRQMPPRWYRDPQDSFTQQSLVWSLGVILLELWYLQDQQALYNPQINWNYVLAQIDGISECWLRELLSVVLQENRPDFIQLKVMRLLEADAKPEGQPTGPLTQPTESKRGSVLEPNQLSLFHSCREAMSSHHSVKGPLQEKIEQIRANYFASKAEPTEEVEERTFEEEMKAKPQIVDLKSDPFSRDRESEATVGSEEYICETYADGALYEGYKKNHLKNGQGSLSYGDGSFYIGQWRNDQMNGFGSLYYPSGKLAYQGQWLNNQFHGKGILFNENPTPVPIDFRDFNSVQNGWVSYQGTFVNDRKTGKGVMKLVNGDRFEGSFKDDTIDGHGVFRQNNHEIQGSWKQNIFRQ